MRNLLERYPILDTLLWILASVAAFAAFLTLAPSILSAPTPTSTLSALPATLTPSPTIPVTPSRTPLPPVPAPNPPAAQTLPPVTGAARLLSVPAEQDLSGWLQTKEEKPHLRDRNLHAGYYRSGVYQGLLYFRVAAIPPGSKLLYAEVVLTGLNRVNLGPVGEWALQLLPASVLADFANRNTAELSGASAAAQIGATYKPAELSSGITNQFIFSQEQLKLIDQAVASEPALAFRIEGPTREPESLFTWDNGGLDPAESTRPRLRIIYEPAKFVVLTNTPTPENVMTAAAQVQTVQAYVTRLGTPTLLPRQYATATPIVLVTALPTPANVETQIARAAFATAVAMTTGTFTPTPENWVVATPNATRTPTITPTPTNTPPFAGLTQTPMRTSTATPRIDQLLQTPIPNVLRGSILFISDRFGPKRLLAMSPAGQLLNMQPTGMDPYNLAFARESYSPNRSHRTLVAPDENGRLQIWIEDQNFFVKQKVTNLSTGMAYDPVWSPDGTRIAYVSTQTGIAELYVHEIERETHKKLTESPGNWIFNQRPSWSPDSTRLVYKSNLETGTFQIYMMQADGTGAHIISRNEFTDTDPVWVK